MCHIFLDWLVDTAHLMIDVELLLASIAPSQKRTQAFKLPQLHDELRGECVLTTDQGNDMALFNDETSMEDEALIDREDAGVRDTPNSVMNLCESSRYRVTITKRMQMHTQVMVPCGYLATSPGRVTETTFASRREVVSVATWPS
jgi:hypothetical protein